jgi:hypothetical protein
MVFWVAVHQCRSWYFELSNDEMKWNILFVEEKPFIWEYVMAQLVEELRYKPEGGGFHSRCGH